MSSLDELLEAFAQDEGGHAELLERLDNHVAAPPAPPMGLDEALRRFSLDERQRARLAADPGFAGDLIVFLSKTLARVDPALRAAFPTLNAFLEGAVPIPGGGFAVGLLLILAEGPLLSLLEGWLARRAAEIEAAELAAGD